MGKYIDWLVEEKENARIQKIKYEEENNSHQASYWLGVYAAFSDSLNKATKFL